MRNGEVMFHNSSKFSLSLRTVTVTITICPLDIVYLICPVHIVLEHHAFSSAVTTSLTRNPAATAASLLGRYEAASGLRLETCGWRGLSQDNSKGYKCCTFKESSSRSQSRPANDASPSHDQGIDHA